MQTGWLLDHAQIGEAVALQKGWYADDGLQFSIRPGGPNIDGVALVAAGRSEVGQVSSSPSVMLAVSQGVPIKAFAVGLQEHPYAYLSLPDNPVHEPKDLVGKKVGTQATGKILLSALLKKHDIDPDDVEVVVVGADITPLTTHQVDVWTGWLSDVGVLRPLGGDYVSLRLWDAGIQLYANPYYATTEMLRSETETLRKFLATTAEGWKFAYENLDQAIDLLVEFQPSLNKADMRAQAEALMPFEFTDATATGGWATMDPAVWQSQIDQHEELGAFKGDTPAVDDVITMDLLEATADQRPKLGEWSP